MGRVNVKSPSEKEMKDMARERIARIVRYEEGVSVELTHKDVTDTLNALHASKYRLTHIYDEIREIAEEMVVTADQLERAEKRLKEIQSKAMRAEIDRRMKEEGL